jgi:hypothetical protein
MVRGGSARLTPSRLGVGSPPSGAPKREAG